MKENILIFLVFLAVIEVGIGAWRMPKEFRVRIIPKLNERIYQYDRINDTQEKILMRLDLLSKVEERKIINKKINR